MFAPYHPGRLLGHPMNESERLLLHQQKLQQAALLIQQEQQARRQQARRMDGERPRTPSQPGLAEMEGRSDDGLVCWPAWSALCCPERLDAFFRISERGSTVAQELRAGAVTFVTMAYILIVNAQVRRGKREQRRVLSVRTFHARSLTGDPPPACVSSLPCRSCRSLDPTRTACG